jgi:hypothetical protein
MFRTAQYRLINWAVRIILPRILNKEFIMTITFKPDSAVQTVELQPGDIQATLDALVDLAGKLSRDEKMAADLVAFAVAIIAAMSAPKVP